MKKSCIYLFIILLNLHVKSQNLISYQFGFKNESWMFSERTFSFLNYYFPTDSTFIREDIYSGGIYMVRKIEGKYIYDYTSETIKFSTNEYPYKITFSGDTAISLTNMQLTENINKSLLDFPHTYRRTKGVLPNKNWISRIGNIENIIYISMDGIIRYCYSDSSRSMEFKGVYFFSDNIISIHLNERRKKDYKYEKLKKDIETQLPIEFIGDSIMKVSNLSSILNLFDCKQNQSTGSFSVNNIILMKAY